MRSVQTLVSTQLHRTRRARGGSASPAFVVRCSLFNRRIIVAKLFGLYALFTCNLNFDLLTLKRLSRFECHNFNP